MTVQRMLAETLAQFKASLDSKRGLELAFALLCDEIEQLKRKPDSNDGETKD